MTYRVVINGYGRIVQCVLRALYQNGYRHGMEVVAINELASIATLAYLTRYDTTHGRFPVQVNADESHLFIGDDRVRIFNQPAAQQLNWQDLNIDLTVQVSRDTSSAEVNGILQLATFGRLEGILGFTNEPHASVDFNHDSRSCIVDGTQTQVSANRLIKLLCWFDNEWGFANRMLDVASYWLAFKE